MDNQPENINRDEAVISIQDEMKIFNKTFKVEEFCNWLNQFITTGSCLSPEQTKLWLEEGVKATILQPNKEWRTGKVRINLEFIPDEVESPLDDIRQGTKSNDEA